MTDLIQTPREELIEALDVLSDEARLYECWFVRGMSIDEDYDFVFDSPHIDWMLIAPLAAKSAHYQALLQAFEKITDDRFRPYADNPHLSIDLVEQSGLWRAIPPAASALRALLQEECPGSR